MMWVVVHHGKRHRHRRSKYDGRCCKSRSRSRNRIYVERVGFFNDHGDGARLQYFRRFGHAHRGNLQRASDSVKIIYSVEHL